MSFEVLQNAHRVYLDYNATTPLARFLMDQIPGWLHHWGNPSSVYQSSKEVRSLIWKAREQVSHFIHCHPLEIIFTSGGSESNNHAIKGLCEKFLNSNRKKIITSSVEHSSVRNTLEWARKKGFDINIIPVSNTGQIDLERYKSALDDRTAFISMMYANNETGCIFPIADLARQSQEVGALFHCDAAQALGKIPIHVKELQVDLLTLSAHKFYSLKGCGVLYCKKGLSLESLIHGGPQERKRRAGTENILSICALGAVSEKGEEVLKHRKKIQNLRDDLEEKIKKEIPQVDFIGKETARIGNSSSILISGIFAETVMMNLDLKGYSVSVSSACHSGSLSPSQVLLGMGYSPEEAQCVLRISLGLGIEKKSLDNFVHTLKSIVQRLRALNKVV